MCFFRIITLYGYVPNDFRSGIVLPLITDKTGDGNVNNYRGITLIPLISKLFELVLIDICEQFLSCDELQFGFKQVVRVPEGICSMRDTIDYFKDRGSWVFVAALDIKKTFDTVDHYKLYAPIIKSGITKWILNVVINWHISLWLL